MALARELDLECDAEDLLVVFRTLTASREGELGDAELARVAGGFGSIGVFKMPAPPAPLAPIPHPNRG